MVQSSDLSDAQIILLATRFIIESNFVQLQLLAVEQKHVLTSNILYRQLLTYLPIESESIAGLVAFLKHLQNGFQDVSNLDDALDKSLVEEASPAELRRKLHELWLDSKELLEDPDLDDSLSSFIVQWLRKMEKVSGIPNNAAQLIEPFASGRPRLTQWQEAYLIPLIKLQNDFYPGRAELLDTQTLERMHGVSGVESLLQFARQDDNNAQVGRDLDEIVTPWVRGASRTKRRRLDQEDIATSKTSWQDVNEWIYNTSKTNFNLAATSFLQWSGPYESSQGLSQTDASNDSNLSASYVQTGLALITTSTVNGDDGRMLLRQILNRAATLSAQAPITSNAEHHTLAAATKADLLENAILHPNNSITYPSDETFIFFEDCLSAKEILENFKLSLSFATLIETALFGSEDRQKQELIRIIQQVPRLTRSEIDWPLVRRRLHNLRSGEVSNTNATKAGTYHFLGRVPEEYLEAEFLDALIVNGQYTTVAEIYLDDSVPPLDKDLVQTHIISAIYAAYDNASNGNRTRGGVKRAHEILQAFQPKFGSARIFEYIEHLIRATHSLSFYHLTLQHGVPFQPATIRIHHDPLSLIEKVLAQNLKAYTKLDDLIEIGRNLVQADLPNSWDPAYSSKSLDERLFDAQHRITFLAISSALADDDFDTAYSYIITRLSTSPSQNLNNPFTDDTSWRAAYVAGKHRPSHASKSLHDRIKNLSRRMDLLSLALTLAPIPDPLSEILATWRRCEEEMDSLKSQALDEERAIDVHTRGHSTLPGGFAEDRDIDVAETRRMLEKRALGGAGPSYEEEAPMGLFDVARGAASALKKSAFPLRSNSGQIVVRDRTESDADSGRDSFDGQRSSLEQQRVRKRDMVSNMVTGGLVSGMSWVLGAPPPKQSDER